MYNRGRDRGHSTIISKFSCYNINKTLSSWLHIRSVVINVEQNAEKGCKLCFSCGYLISGLWVSHRVPLQGQFRYGQIR